MCWRMEEGTFALGFVQIARPCSCNRIIMIPYVAIYTTTVIIINDAIISIIVSVSLLPRFLPFFFVTNKIWEDRSLR